MNRRKYLSSLTATAVALSGCSAIGTSPDDSQPKYYGQDSVVYKHESLDLRLRQETVRLGDSIEFEVTNTSDSVIDTGCHTPWALQKHSDGDWRHVTWTGEDFFNLCGQALPPGRTIEKALTLSTSELESQADEVHGELAPGTYRFLLIGTSPYVALDFDVLQPV